MIRSFIDAVILHQQQGEPASASHFDFSNYGYQPLAADYLTQFTAMTSAVGQFAAGAGKTAVNTRAIGKRASNDPRGQHPDYQSDSDDDAAAGEQEAQPTAETASSVPSDVTEAHEASALVAETQADNVSEDSAELLDATSKAASDDAVSNDDSITAEAKDDNAKAKTTIASYKNMIENVAEQLLPQTGMFNLTTPKVPKARSRKPKTEHKKPTQAEKMNDKGDKD